MSGGVADRICAPVLAVSGLSGSGKTTLLEAVIPQLISSGISVAVIKHDAHGIKLDTSGKDSDRLFRAGATVALRGPDQQLLRRQSSSSLSLYATLKILSHDHDLLLVEGHKNTPLPKLWLEDLRHSQIPRDVTNVVGVLKWDANRVEAFLAFVEGWLPVAWQRRPLRRGLLLGHHASSPASAILTLAHHPQHTALEGIALLGPGTVPSELQCLPHIPDPPGIDGPVAPLIAAHRWAPTAAWIFTTREYHLLPSPFVEWLVSMRVPGRWSVIPRHANSGRCCMAGLYEPQALALLERSFMESSEYNAGIDGLIKNQRTLIADVPFECIQPLSGIHEETVSLGLANWEEANAKF